MQPPNAHPRGYGAPQPQPHGQQPPFNGFPRGAPPNGAPRSLGGPGFAPPAFGQNAPRSGGAPAPFGQQPGGFPGPRGPPSAGGPLGHYPRPGPPGGFHGGPPGAPRSQDGAPPFRPGPPQQGPPSSGGGVPPMNQFPPRGGMPNAPGRMPMPGQGPPAPGSYSGPPGPQGSFRGPPGPPGQSGPMSGPPGGRPGPPFGGPPQQGAPFSGPPGQPRGPPGQAPFPGAPQGPPQGPPGQAPFPGGHPRGPPGQAPFPGAPQGPPQGPPGQPPFPGTPQGPPGQAPFPGAHQGPPGAHQGPPGQAPFPGAHQGPPGQAPYPGAPQGPPGQAPYPGAPQGPPGQAPYPGAPGGYQQPPPPQGYPGAPQQPAAQQQPKQRIDPNQIPRPIVSTDRIQYVARGHTVTMPPPATSDFVCVDEGTCNPRFIRPTLNHVPSNKDVLKQCGLPLAAVICPLAELREDELPIPLVDFGPNGPLRCTRCRAYVNSYTKFIQGGKKFVCNICALSNETPRDYYCSVDQNGRRRDVQERAELCRGSVDYVVPAAYTLRPPQEPIFVFVLDVSLFSFQTSLAQATLDAIKYLLPSLAQNRRKKIGIVTFDSSVHYYRMDHSKTISVAMCPDIDDPPAPLPPSSWLVSMEDPNAQDRVHELADLILKTYEEAPKNQAVSGAALSSVVDALSVSGGRVILLHAGAPRIGVGKIRREEVSGAYGTTKEVDLYTPEETNQYEALAKKCADSHISLDVFSVANPFSSLADIGRVCELTGGRVAYLPQFEKEKVNNRHHLRTMLQRIVDRDCGYEAVLKIRCSAGLRVERAYGNFFTSRANNGLDVDEMEFSVIDQDRSVCVTFAYDEPLAEGSDAYIQAALLYTRSDGIRCVRVHNLALPVEPILSNVFRFADLDATCSVWQRVAAKQFVDKSLMRTNPVSVKDNLVNECVNVLFNYRKHCAASSSSGQLILPESLKLLPLYTLATLKSRALRMNLTGNPPRGFIDVRADERVMMMGVLNSLPVEFAVSAVYPKLYSLHDMPEDCGTFDEDGKFVLPLQLPPTAEKLDESGIFLLHSAMNCYIYIGPRVSTELLVELFGVEHVDTAETTLDLFERFENEPEDGLRARVRDVVEYMNSMMPISQPLEILSKNDWRSSRFMSSLVEDRTRNDVSYVEFLVQVHKKIQHKFHG
ncbi:hypothetical protein Poli38472_007851 [Pythium oligandrum]|uniref:Protein transport protein Sec24-like n=1 Tax=Pythium oligandrum TaxID=41045 RepID=A0A8K1CS08_PYTOL|nr:hypothetical protein Poli38472_007851 [Pythium oligandrum]|eukprot:TMW68179.1 hypothetical protein Poli38472_007851 [Pythium oligandrum]